MSGPAPAHRPVAAPNERSVAELWRAYLARIGETPEATGRTFTAWAFGDHADLADELCALVLEGTKRATAGSVAEYEAEGEPIPRAGDLSVVTDGAGIARCVIRTTRVDLVPFDEIDEDFARTEGEGDKTLAWWREAHARYYERRGEQLGIDLGPNPLIAAERFELVHAPLLDDPVATWDHKAALWHEQVGDEGDPNRRLNSDPALWRILGEVRGLDVLDAGCGTGYLSRQLARKGARVVGVDASAAMVAIAAERAEAITAELERAGEATGAALVPPTHHVDDASVLATIADASVDRVASNYVLMDLADLDGAARAMARVLRPGGRAAVVISHPCFPQGEDTWTDRGEPDADRPRPIEVTYRWSRNYFHDDQRLEPAWGRFAEPFPCFERSLSRYFAAFRAAGLAVTDLEEPHFDPSNPPAGFDASEHDAQRLHRSSFLPYSVAFGLAR